MNKNIFYILGAVLVGLLAGWFIFGGSPNGITDSKNESLITETHDHSGDSQDQMWTCSMHPQIMLAESGDCPICGMELIPAESSTQGLAANQFKMTPNAMALANIQTTRVGQQKADQNTIALSGKIAENQEANLVQASYFSGRIERLNISFTGEQVQKGMQLATIYSPELYAAQQELITAATLKKSQPALYKAVRNKLKIWKLSDKQIDQIELSGQVRENFPIYATVSGTVTQKLVEQGDYVKQGQALFKIANLSTVWANFDVYENQINQFKQGQTVTVTTNAYPNQEFNGKVDFIDPILNTSTRTLKLRVVLTNKGGLFKPGMFVKALIETINTGAEQQITIPATAVLWTGERSVVYIKTDPNQPIFELREVVLGNRIGEQYQILEGISNGEEIVINGTFTVDAAAQLQGKKSMMNQEGGKIKTSHEGHLDVNDDVMKNKSAGQKSLQRIKVNPSFSEQLTQVFDNYTLVKDALVSDNMIKVAKNATLIVDNIEAIDMALLTTTKAHNSWMALSKRIKTDANTIANSQEIKEQRVYFKQLSISLGEAIQIFGINNKVYQQFCPMADNDKGASWLSLQEKVLNPYFGKAMLNCGEIVRIIE